MRTTKTATATYNVSPAHYGFLWHYFVVNQSARNGSASTYNRAVQFAADMARVMDARAAADAARAEKRARGNAARVARINRERIVDGSAAAVVAAARADAAADAARADAAAAYRSRSARINAADNAHRGAFYGNVWQAVNNITLGVVRYHLRAAQGCAETRKEHKKQIMHGNGAGIAAYNRLYGVWCGVAAAAADAAAQYKRVYNAVDAGIFADYDAPSMRCALMRYDAAAAYTKCRAIMRRMCDFDNKALQYIRNDLQMPIDNNSLIDADIAAADAAHRARINAIVAAGMPTITDAATDAADVIQIGYMAAMDMPRGIDASNSRIGADAYAIIARAVNTYLVKQSRAARRAADVETDDNEPAAADVADSAPRRAAVRMQAAAPCSYAAVDNRDYVCGLMQFVRDTESTRAAQVCAALLAGETMIDISRRLDVSYKTIQRDRIAIQRAYRAYDALTYCKDLAL